ncbi:hypothetical protein ACFLVH_00755 [Chloroflexota bacterium]
MSIYFPNNTEKIKRGGRGVRYQINPDLSLRHDTHHEVAIGDFLKSLGWKRPDRQRSEKILIDG